METTQSQPSTASGIKISRRSALGALTAASYSRLLGANDRVQVGFMGYGLIGSRHVGDFQKLSDVDVAAICDVYEPRVEAGVAATGGRAKLYRDFRRMLEDNDIQAVVVSTPDHWHALATMMACAAGKDVYVEKPMTLFVKEGRWMTQVARKNKRVVQVGTQQRSGTHYQSAKRLMQSGYLGQIMSVRDGCSRNAYPGFTAPLESTPADFNYDMWLGPAPLRPYDKLRGIYHFRWFWDYSGGQMTNLCAHEMDIAHWVMDVHGPKVVASAGGRRVLKDDCETPDIQEAFWDFGTFMYSYYVREAGEGLETPSGLQFIGSKGTLSISRGGFRVSPDMKVNPLATVPGVMREGHPIGGPRLDPDEVHPEPWIEAVEESGDSNEQFTLHARNFIDCIKSRERPVADVEDGHEVATSCHLANIALRLGGRALKWDAVNEQIIGDEEANAMLERPYRAPWDEVVQSLLA